MLVIVLSSSLLSAILTFMAKGFVLRCTEEHISEGRSLEGASADIYYAIGIGVIWVFYFLLAAFLLTLLAYMTRYGFEILW